MMKIRIHWKLAAAFCSLVVVVLIATYFYLNSNLTNYIESRTQDSLKKELLLNKDYLDSELSVPIDQSKAKDVVTRIAKDLGVRATIINYEGMVVSDSDLSAEDLKRVENHLARVEVRMAIATGFGQKKHFSTTIRKEMLYMAVPIGKIKPLGILRLAIPLHDIDLVSQKTQKIIGASLLFGVLLTILLSIALSFMISKPIHEISMVAERLSKGDFSKKAPVFSNDEIGELARTLNYMSEEIKNKLERITSEEAKLEAILMNMSEGVILTDEIGQILLANPSARRLFMIDSRPEGKMPIEVIRNASVQDIISGILAGRERLTTEEISVYLPDERLLQVNCVRVKKEGSAAGALLVFHDITELRHLENIRKDFVANVSHELRTPISSIKGYAETLLEGALDDKKNAKEFVSIIHQDSDRLAKLIEDLLDLSKVESGKHKMSFASVNIYTIAKRAVSILEGAAKAKKLFITINISQELPKALADEAQLSQVFINLIDNAVKYTPVGGKITIDAASQDGSVHVDVTDTGIGIPEEDLPRIFERFYRVDKARSRELGGTGLGLSIVKHIIQAHGGTVQVKSQLGHGSAFSFTIPTVY
jgi:two-component system phosphate regulon sensor histidine kinase PhoR